MKICIASSGPSENSMIDSRFGRCPYFIIHGTKTKKYAVVKNEAGGAFRGAGITTAQKVADMRCGAIVTGNIGPNAHNVLSQAGIKIFSGVFEKSVKQVIEDYKKGKLKESNEENVSFGPDRGFGGRKGGRR